MSNIRSPASSRSCATASDASSEADQADDHVDWYRHAFDGTVRQLRCALDIPAPDIHEIAVAAMQAAWLARIWPVLQSVRLQRRGPANLKDRNTKSTTGRRATRTAASPLRARCAANAGCDWSALPGTVPRSEGSTVQADNQSVFAHPRNSSPHQRGVSAIAMSLSSTSWRNAKPNPPHS